jgi:hypothetical protein
MKTADEDMPENPGRDDESPGEPIPWNDLPVRPDKDEQVFGWTSGPCLLAGQR